VVAVPTISPGVRSVLRAGLVRAFGAIGSLLFTVVLARTLPKEAVGEFAVAFTIMAIISMIARFGYDITLLRFGGAEWEGKPTPGFQSLSRFALGSVVRNAACIATIAVLASFAVRSLEHRSFFTVMLLLSVPWSLMYVVSFLLKAIGLPATGSMFEVGIISFIASFVIMALHRSGRDTSLDTVATVLAATTVVALTTGITLLLRRGLLARTNQPYEQNDAFFKATRNVAAVMIVQLLANQSGNLILRLVADPTEVANFSVALRLATATMVAFNLIYVVVGPRISAAHSRGETETALRVARRFTTLLMMLAGPVLLVLLIVPGRITTIFGAQYSASATPVAIMAGGQLLAVLMSLGPMWLAMTGSEDLLRNVTFSSAVVGVGVTAVLSSLFGASGAAVGVAIYQVGIYWLSGFAAWRRDGVVLVPAMDDISRLAGALRRSTT